MIFDTHSHCYWDSIEPRIDEVIANMQRNRVVKATQIGCDVLTSEKAIDLARRYPGIFYATVGLHPETAQEKSYSENNEDIINRFDGLIRENLDLVVAVGECGFDFHYLDGSEGGSKRIDLDNLSLKAQNQIDNQKYWWFQQWNLAQKYNLPLIIHTRDARDTTLEFMKDNNINRCVMHCFSEDWEFARELLEFSDEIYFSFSGIVTYKKSDAIQEAAKNIPIHRILVETDAPFLSPQPVRGTVNEPANTVYNLSKIAEIKGMDIDEAEETLYNNSLRFYNIS